MAEGRLRILNSVEGRSQLIDAATSVAANYRAACRARSRAEFVSKIAVSCEEADESLMWLKMCGDLGLCSRSAVAALSEEAEQLCRIFTASQLTAKRRRIAKGRLGNE